MKLHLLTILTAGAAQAVPIPYAKTIDLGAPTISVDATFPLPDLIGAPISGDEYTLSFTFESGQFIRLFNAALFGILLQVQTDYSGIPAFTLGTGYVTDSLAISMEPPQALGSFSSSDGLMTTILFPIEGGDLAAPVDFYGVHMDITLPDHSPSTITGASVRFMGGPFGVGPAILPSPLPDSGGTLILSGLAVLCLVASRKVYR